MHELANAVQRIGGYHEENKGTLARIEKSISEGRVETRKTVERIFDKIEETRKEGAATSVRIEKVVNDHIAADAKAFGELRGAGWVMAEGEEFVAVPSKTGLTKKFGKWPRWIVFLVGIAASLGTLIGAIVKAIFFPSVPKS